ncbi:metalloregulator ArsR/SmtB family transcription factor [Phenylobacterium sp. LjRoot164]|uniref:ArsR/SmtB family transcription factor n=1 Tax=unclassified Phenylobacterium TaxID=2640670 RepID=UPI003ECC398B
MLDLANFDIARFEASAAEAARLLRALANERRLMILCQLGDRERSVGELLPLVGLSQSALSQHLALLREEGIVATSRESQTVRYRIADSAAVRVVETLAEIFCPPDMRSPNERRSDPAQT